MFSLLSRLLLAALITSPVWGGQDFERGPARSPHGALSIACTSCHTATSWTPIRAVPDFDHNSQTRFSLRGLHANVECRLCHTKLVFSNVGSKCADCHADIHRGQFAAACDACHTVKGWRVEISAIRSHQNRFPLLGAHATTECASCHQGGASAQFTGLSTDCSACHLKDYQQTKVLNHQASSFPLTCGQCHGVDNWNPKQFDHAQFAKFVLDGPHAQQECSACHPGGRFAGTPSDCFGCHSQDYAAAKAVDHVKAGFPKDCTSCHNSMSWKGAQFNHSALTKFPLAGAHTSVECSACHIGGMFAGTRSECYACHVANYEAIKNPDHVQSHFATDCTGCHTTASWQNARFDHALARFPLTGAHTSASCAQCHVNGRYTGTPALCSACHLTNYQKTTSPNHVAGGFPQDCTVCHTTAQWTGAKFDHSAKTKFTLTGAHVPLTCSQCHTNGQYAGLSAQCAACHLADYQKSAKPNHVAAALPQDCSQCHTTVQWTGAKFDHSTKTTFPLAGAHVPLTCNQCHSSGQYAGLSTQCTACHLPDYQKAANPNHVAGGFPQDCTVCHTTAQWTGAKFDHSAKTKFTLTGAHVPLTCSQCHTNGQYAGLSTQCAACHLADYQKTTSPNHVAANFSQDCSACHTTVQFKGAAFNHSTTTKFALTGAHVPLTCNQCHSSGQYAGLSTQCAACHLPDYQKAANPNHVAGGFPQDCAVCHTTAQWTGGKFDHTTKTKFTLTGAHVPLNCNQCHTNGQYTGLSTQCAACHLPDYQKAANPNHVAAAFPQDCTVCHTTTLWTGAKFDHTTKTTFPLIGSHVPLTCNQCHSSGKYAGLSTQCVSCHLTSFQKTTNPNHVAGGFPQDCAVCHITTQWTGAKFDHNTNTKFTLTGAHVQTDCAQCHKNGVFAGTPTQCASCHLPEYQKTTNPNHAAAGMSQSCTTCHTTTQWAGASFDHNRTKFALAGAHVTLTCAQCHSSGVYAGLATTCVSCHLTNFQKTTNPNHVASGFPQDCTLCHTPAQWTGAKFDHTTKTTFPLTGSHVLLTCAQCHSAGVYAGLATTCVSCHLTNFQKTTNPNHVTAAFPQDCTVCHTTAQWTGARFDHTTKTTFPLTGSHVPLTCAQCHSSGVYAGLATTCVSCHLTNFQKTTNPNHVAAAFPQDCTVCHTTAQWTGAKFDHTTKTTFPLTGSHVPLTCAQCHSSGKYAGLSTQCVSCHLTNFQKTTNPNHVTGGFPQDCTVCHTTAQWTGAKFDHTTKTTFPLTGSHVPLTCAQCHSSGVYAGLATTCVSCHLTNFQKTTNPNHVAAAFPQDCTLCHTTTQWPGASFNHTTKTTFPLTGAHVPLTCAQCHSSGVYAGLATTCVSCHLKNYQGTTNPNHVAGAFPQDCTVCHTTAQWTGAKFDHTTKTTFPLTGSHILLTCAQCHSSGVYAGLATTCVSCHLKNYQGTTNPNHVAGAFPQDCTLCHTTTQWPGASFNHTTKTTFPLTGAHVPLTCAQCHSSGKYAGLSTQCVSCHLTNYQKTTNPNHAAAGFPQDCAACHTTTTFTGATFDHSTKTKFPLTGTHVNVACSQCHSSGQYAGLSTQCVSCHLANYQKTTNPNHVSAGFPQDCSLCHTTTQWPGAAFNHTTKTTFPLTGSHVPLTCTQCHSSGVYAGLATTCVSCHLKNYQATTNPNHTAAGFPQDCSVCHSTTRWTGAAFNHAAAPFPLVGKHVGLACSLCHSSGVYVGLSTTCVSCHLKNYQATTTPNHTTGGFPQQCELCHTPTGWTPSSFNHATTVFPLTGFHTSVACANCHVGGKYVGTPTACYSCHKALYDTTTNPNHTAAGFPTTCQTCHTTTVWTGATFNHTWFPMTHNRAAGCSTCHINSSDYKVFQCTNCHAKATTDSHHSGRSGYVYNSINCYQCHPRGSGG